MAKLWPNLDFQSKCTQRGGSFSFKRNLALVCDSLTICIVFEAFSPLGRFASYFGRRIEQLFLNGMLLSASHYLGNVEYLASHGLLAHIRLFEFLYSITMSITCSLSQMYFKLIDLFNDTIRHQLSYIDFICQIYCIYMDGIPFNSLVLVYDFFSVF